jgi:hypothetical protein
MTFQNLCEIFKCTHEESLALWDYLMFLRIKGMLRQPPLPAITKKDMEFVESREASPLTVQRWNESLRRNCIPVTDAFQDVAAHVDAIVKTGEASVEKAPGDTAPTQAEWIAQIKKDVEELKRYPSYAHDSNAAAAIPVTQKMVMRCHNCHESMYFHRVPEGAYIMCHYCGADTQFNSQGGAK